MTSTVYIIYKFDLFTFSYMAKKITQEQYLLNYLLIISFICDVQFFKNLTNFNKSFMFYIFYIFLIGNLLINKHLLILHFLKFNMTLHVQFSEKRFLKHFFLPINYFFK